MAAIGAAVGAVLGAGQVIRDNAGTWQAVHATVPTVAVQTAAGGVIGGLVAGLAVAYWASLGGRVTPGPVAATSVETRPAAVVTPRAGLGVRQVFVLAFGVGLMAVGGVILRACLGHPTIYGVLRGGFMAVFFVGLGGYLVWDDFVAPLVRRRGVGG
jgi:hypothetical protein